MSQIWNNECQFKTGFQNTSYDKTSYVTYSCWNIKQKYLSFDKAPSRAYTLTFQECHFYDFYDTIANQTLRLPESKRRLCPNYWPSIRIEFYYKRSLWHRTIESYGSRYSRMNQVKFVKDSIKKFWLGPLLNTLTHMKWV